MVALSKVFNLLSMVWCVASGSSVMLHSRPTKSHPGLRRLHATGVPRQHATASTCRAAIACRGPRRSSESQHRLRQSSLSLQESSFRQGLRQSICARRCTRQLARSATERSPTVPHCWRPDCKARARIGEMNWRSTAACGTKRSLTPCVCLTAGAHLRPVIARHARRSRS